MKREALITPKIEKFLKQNKIYSNWEIKQTTTDSLLFSSVPDRQINSLIAAQHEGYSWKHSDVDPRVKMFDGSTVAPMIGYIVIKYPKCITFITVNNFVHARETNRKKSLDVEKAIKLADKIIQL